MATYQGSCIDCGRSDGHGFLDCPQRAARVQQVLNQIRALADTYRELFRFQTDNQPCPACRGGKIHAGKDLKRCAFCHGTTVIARTNFDAADVA